MAKGFLWAGCFGCAFYAVLPGGVGIQIPPRSQLGWLSGLLAAMAVTAGVLALIQNRGGYPLSDQP
jgi:hypothetical protein